MTDEERQEILSRQIARQRFAQASTDMNAAVSEVLDPLSDADLADLKADVLAALEPAGREFLAKHSPRTCGALRKLIFARLKPGAA